MKRWLLLLSCLFAAGAFAARPGLRTAEISGLRSIAEPLLEKGAATEPHFDAFYADMVEGLPLRERVERALELAINRRDGAAEYLMRHAQGWRGSFAPSDRLNTLVNLAGDSPLIEVRMAAFEVHLAEYGLEKIRRRSRSPAAVDDARSAAGVGLGAVEPGFARRARRRARTHLPGTVVCGACR